MFVFFNHFRGRQPYFPRDFLFSIFRLFTFFAVLAALVTAAAAVFAAVTATATAGPFSVVQHRGFTTTALTTTNTVSRRHANTVSRRHFRVPGRKIGKTQFNTKKKVNTHVKTTLHVKTIRMSTYTLDALDTMESAGNCREDTGSDNSFSTSLDNAC